jgi:hypothetical protein
VARIVQKLDWCAMYFSRAGIQYRTCGENCAVVGLLCNILLQEKLLELGLPTLEERRHQADKIQTFKIVRGIDRVDYNMWFQLASEIG